MNSTPTQAPQGTPRTDAQLEICQRDPLVPLWPLCKDLERELATAQAQLKESNETKRIADNALRDLDRANNYAAGLARVIYEKHYREASPDFKPFTDTLGLLTQIDNMHAGVAEMLATTQGQLRVAVERVKELEDALEIALGGSCRDWTGFYLNALKILGEKPKQGWTHRDAIDATIRAAARPDAAP